MSEIRFIDVSKSYPGSVEVIRNLNLQVEEGEFMQYEVEVDSSGIYDIHFRYSANNNNSKIYFTLNDTAFTESTSLTNTNNWSFWNTKYFT